MSLAVLAFGVMAFLAVAYLTYGRFVARQYRLDPEATTPAVALADGVDYVPTPRFYLLAQHFSAIAAAGPIVGPIVAASQFGWLPCLLWIGLGVVLIGAVHDLSALVASVRHDGRSIAEIVRQHVSPRAWVALLVFIWLALVYVIVAFVDVTAGTFQGRIEELNGVEVRFERGGAVAFASLAYLALALLMGLVGRRLRVPLWLQTAIFVPATFAVVWLGTKLSTLLVLGGANPHLVWSLLILAYCFVASLLPVSVLLQPRGYLGGFVLYAVLATSIVGLLFGRFRVELPAFKGFDVPGATGLLFPFLFVTIACGACSGFHGLVCSGTTSKQVRSESDCHAVGFGAMLLEGFVAVIALATVMMAVPAPGTPPGAVYGQGIGRFLAVLLGPERLLFAVTFGSMAFSTFVFDTLDVATRLGRYIVQELFGLRGRAGAVLATLATVGAPLVLVLGADPPAPGRAPGYMAFWTLFGTSNQLLAGLTLLAVTVWLRRSGRPAWFAMLPMAFVFGVTVSALVLQAGRGLAGGGGLVGTLNAAVALALLGLTALIAGEAVRALRRPGTATTPGARSGA